MKRTRVMIKAALALTTVGLSCATAVAQPTTSNPSTPELVPVDASVGEATSQTVTLLTGQTLRVHTTVNGQVTVTRPLGVAHGRNDGQLLVQSLKGSDRSPRLTALVPSAMEMIEAGVIDPNLFNISYLTKHGYGVTSPTPVTVYYNEQTSAQQAATDAKALPGSHYVEGSATDGAATVAVNVNGGDRFWKAVTQTQPVEPGTPEGWAWKGTPPTTPRVLADGIAALTLDRAAPAAPHGQVPHRDLPTYTVKIRVHGSKDRHKWEYLDKALGPGSGFLQSVTEQQTGDLPATIFCQDPQCRVMVFEWVVEEGIYQADANVRLWTDARLGYARILEPQIRVNGDVTLNYYVDQFSWIGSDTPRPSELTQLVYTEQRLLPEGQIRANLAFFTGDGFVTGLYLAPSQTEATIGSYDLMITELRQQSRIDLKVVAPKRHPLELPAQYALGSPFASIRLTTISAEHERMEIVDVGNGTSEEVANADVDGKLAFLKLGNPEGPNMCSVANSIIDRIHKAGARAIIVDPSLQPIQRKIGAVNPSCPTPINVDGGTENYGPASIPLITIIDPQEARALGDLIEQDGATTLEVNSPPAEPEVGSPNQRLKYYYELAHDFVGDVPSSIDETVEKLGLATRVSKIGLGIGDDIRLQVVPTFPSPNPLLAAATLPHSMPEGRGSVVTEYIGPVSPDLTWRREWYGVHGDGTFVDTRSKMVNADDRVERFFTKPITYGPPVPQGTGRLEGPWKLCNFCRHGNTLFPFTGRTSGAAPSHAVGAYGLLPHAQLLDEDGHKVPLTFSGGLPVYELAAEPQTYTFSSSSDAGTFKWKFQSATVDDTTPKNTTCWAMVLFGAPCGEPVPMIYVRYDAPVDIDNKAPAGGHQTLEVTAYHEGFNAPAIGQVATQVSFDGGDTWKNVRMRRTRNGSWLATFKVPDLGDTSGSVSLRTEAIDAEGNSTSQTQLNAYGLKTDAQGLRPKIHRTPAYRHMHLRR